MEAIGYSTLRRLFQYQTNTIANSGANPGPPADNSRGYGRFRNRNRRYQPYAGGNNQGANANSKGRGKGKGGGNSGGGGGQGGGKTGGKKGGGKGKGQNAGYVQCAGKPFWDSYQGNKLCVAYNRGQPCPVPNCTQLHYCSFVGCEKGHIPGGCKAADHKGLSY